MSLSLVLAVRVVIVVILVSGVVPAQISPSPATLPVQVVYGMPDQESQLQFMGEPEGFVAPPEMTGYHVGWISPNRYRIKAWVLQSQTTPAYDVFVFNIDLAFPVIPAPPAVEAVSGVQSNIGYEVLMKFDVTLYTGNYIVYIVDRGTRACTAFAI